MSQQVIYGLFIDFQEGYLSKLDKDQRAAFLATARETADTLKAHGATIVWSLMSPTNPRTRKRILSAAFLPPDERAAYWLPEEQITDTTVMCPDIYRPDEILYVKTHRSALKGLENPLVEHMNQAGKPVHLVVLGGNTTQCVAATLVDAHLSPLIVRCSVIYDQLIDGSRGQKEHQPAVWHRRQLKKRLDALSPTKIAYVTTDRLKRSLG